MHDKTIRLRGKPSSSARSALEIADVIKASRVTSAASLGSGKRALASIISATSPGSRLPQLTPDTYRFIEIGGDFDHGRELLVLLAPKSDIAGIDAKFSQGLCTLGILCQQYVTVVVEIADQRYFATYGIEHVADSRDLLGGLFGVYRNPNQL